MQRQTNSSEVTPHFMALVRQCLARVQAAAEESGQSPPDPEALARCVASIASDNRRRKRVPQHEPPNPQTGVPDSYIDEVLSFLRKEGPTLRALRAGEEAAWERVLATLRARAYNYLLQYGVEPAHARQLAPDFAQTCAATLWEQALERFPYDTYFEAWVSQIAAYEVSRWRRSTKEQHEQRAHSLDVPANEQTEESLYERLPDFGSSRALDIADARMILEEALQMLPSEDQRQTLLLQLSGQDDQEIAIMLGRTRQAIYNLRHRALRKLRNILGDTYQD